MPEPEVHTLQGHTFLVSDRAGDVQPGPNQVLGLFHRDVRHLSRWQLTIEGAPLKRLSHDASGHTSTTFFLAGPAPHGVDPTLSVTRRRTLSEGAGEALNEELLVINSGRDEIVVALSLAFAADFADLFEVKDQQLTKAGLLSQQVQESQVELSYHRGEFARRTIVQAKGASLDQGTAIFRLRLAPGQTWASTVRVACHASPDRPDIGAARLRAAEPRRPGVTEDGLEVWLADAPTLQTSWDTLRNTYDRSLRDLAALRLPAPAGRHDGVLPAAGLPWFMAVFGRDSLLTSYQTLPFVPHLTATTLRVLADLQATEVDDFRDAEPGKILHELRFGELTYFRQRPHSPYYGSADATPLFLILLEEYERWSGDTDLVRDLEPHARAAVRWLDHYGDLDGDGYLEYERRNTDTGLVNQCWKDSEDSVVHPDGRLAALPRATCELQGYAYDARVRTARLAREVWGDEAWAARLDRDAAALRARFNEDFWVAGPGFFALALEGRKEQVRTLTSNIGHLLWSGIVDEAKVPLVVGHLMAEPLFSGWGVRTLAADQPAYNPLSYHNGTVWPHDNALIAAGLARYGYHEEAGRIAVAMLQAAAHLDYRLPEVFAGYPRSLTRFPVAYPTACSPQAWAAGTPLLLLRVLLGLEPHEDGLRSDPHVPAEIGSLGLDGVPGRWGRVGVGPTPD